MRQFTRQERIFARAGLALPRSTLGEWVGVNKPDGAPGAA
jgi:transposase